MTDRAEQRDREVARTGHRPMVSPFATKVVGVSFVPAFPDNLYALDDVCREALSTVCGECRGEGGFVNQHEDGWDGERCEICNGTRKREPEPLPAILVRNPANAYDANAIEVHVPALGEAWAMIGHLTRPIAARMAPEIDAGKTWRAQVESVLIHPDHLDDPGISIRCARLEETDGI